MKNEWIRISPAEAEKHEFYGVGGWLWVFSLGVILGLMANLGVIRGAAFEVGLSFSEFLSLDDPIISFFKFSAIVQFLTAVVIFWMMIAKTSGFRKVATGLLIGATPVVLLAGVIDPFMGFGQIAVQSLVAWLLSCAVWCSYFHCSRRVRVTFEHLVRNSDLQGTTNLSPQTVSKSADLLPSSSKIINSEKLVASVEDAQMFREKPSVDTVDEQFWAEALREVDGTERRAGLWARSFAQVKGDETQAKVAYLEARARELAEAHQDLLGEQERVQRMKEQEERLAELREAERAYDLLPKGFCPTCKYVQPINSKKCPKCEIVFGEFFCVKPLSDEKS